MSPITTCVPGVNKVLEVDTAKGVVRLRKTPNTCSFAVRSLVNTQAFPKLLCYYSQTKQVVDRRPVHRCVAAGGGQMFVATNCHDI